MVHILMLGSTGATGLEFVEAALQRGHQITLHVKTPGKLPGAIGLNPNVRVSVYETLGDFDSLERVLACGATVFVSLEGPQESSKGTPVTNTMKFIFQLLHEFRYERALILGTTAYRAPEDKGGLKWKASVRLTKMTGGDAFADFAGLGTWISTQPSEVVKWTMFRIHHLTDGAMKPVTATYTGSGKDRTNLSRKSMVNWVLEEMVKGEWIGIVIWTSDNHMSCFSLVLSAFIVEGKGDEQEYFNINSLLPSTVQYGGRDSHQTPTFIGDRPSPRYGAPKVGFEYSPQPGSVIESSPICLENTGSQ